MCDSGAIYIIDCRKIGSSFSSLFETLSEEEKASIGKKIKREDQELALAKFLLLHRLFDKPILTHSNGKPFVEGGPHFSISHSFPYCVVYVSSYSCGVDIEVLKECRGEFLTRYFLEEESDYGLSLLQRWNLKEAAYKAIGEGYFNPKEYIENLDEECFVFHGKKVYYHLLEWNDASLAIASLEPMELPAIVETSI